MSFMLHLLTLRFEVLAPIYNLPHFHGPHWSGLFRNLLRLTNPELAKGLPVIWVQPIECGIISYEPGEYINLGVTADRTHAPALARLLEGFNTFSGGNGHFQPAKTIRLESQFSRLTGEPWRPSDPPLSVDHITSEIERLLKLKQFTIETISPWRITRPAGKKSKQHRYCDADFFQKNNQTDSLLHLFKKIRHNKSSITPAGSSLAITDSDLTWLDISYGGKAGKSMGGVVGSLEITGTPTREECQQLIMGQYYGLGKNAAFGLGFYNIPQLDEYRVIKPLCRATTLLARANNVTALHQALSQLPDSSPGPDGMSRADARAAGTPFLEMLQQEAAQTKSKDNKVALKRYILPKSSGGQRSIYVQNMAEKILHRSYANTIAPVIDALLSASSFAYRRGLSRKNAAGALKKLLAAGFTRGIKADISSFFDSVDPSRLTRIMRGLFPNEPLIERLTTWLSSTSAQGISGLPQGWTLSPVLSNLYLDRFDQKMADEGFRLVRYADDFVALFNSETSRYDCMEIIQDTLARLGLNLQPEKTETLVHGKSLKFLGYMVSAQEIRGQERPDEPQDEEWAPVFRAEWQHGIPVYLTSGCRGAFSNGPNLVIKQEDGSSNSINWNRVSRLIVVGRSTFSGGVVYRAVREQIPITFIDIMGRTTGHLLAAGQDVADISSMQAVRKADKEWSLNLARQLVATKMQNQFVLLRRNKIKAPQIKELQVQAEAAADIDTLRGYEGAASRIYFGHFASLVAPFTFDGRCYHPPDGPVNTMLSFGYTLIYNRLTAVLADKGFNPRQGFFHIGRGRHAALASDIQEPLRHLTDRIVLALIHLREITPADFSQQQTRGQTIWRLEGNGFRTFIKRYEKTMAARFSRKNGAKISYNAWLDETVDDLVRAVRFNTPYQPLKIE